MRANVSMEPAPWALPKAGMARAFSPQQFSYDLIHNSADAAFYQNRFIAIATRPWR